MSCLADIVVKFLGLLTETGVEVCQCAGMVWIKGALIGHSAVLFAGQLHFQCFNPFFSLTLCIIFDFVEHGCALCSQGSFLIESALGFDQIIFETVDFVAELGDDIFTVFFLACQGLFGLCKLCLQTCIFWCSRCFTLQQLAFKVVDLFFVDSCGLF